MVEWWHPTDSQQRAAALLRRIAARFQICSRYSKAGLLFSEMQVAVFDTTFHATMPPEAYTYALPIHLTAAHRIRRYGEG